MVDGVVSAAHQAEGLARVVAVKASPGAVGLGAEAGGAAPARHRRELKAAVGEQPQHIRTRPPVPQAGQDEQGLIDLAQRLPADRNARLVIGHDRHQVDGDRGDVGSRGGVGQRDAREAIGRAYAQSGEEPRHRAGMAVQHPTVVTEQLQAEPVAAGPDVVAGRRGGSSHLGQRLRGQDPLVAVKQERGEPAQVVRGRPKLSGRGHQPGAFGRLELHDIRPRMHGEPLRVRRVGRHGGAGHAERVQDLLAQRLLPGPPAQLPDERAEQPVTGIGVVEQPSGRMPRGPEDVG